MTPNDGPGAAPEHDDTPSPDSRRGADPPPPGSVAQEAALLLDLLSQRGWSGGSGMPSAGASARAAEGGAPSDRTDDGAGSHGSHGPSAPDGTGSRPDGRASATRECTCGGTTPAACRVCPVCQLIAFVQQVDPDTIERVADFVGFAATALRDLATAQRERAQSADRHPSDPAGPSAGATDES